VNLTITRRLMSTRYGTIGSLDGDDGDQDDLVSNCISILCRGVTTMCLLWLCSFVLIQIDVLYEDTPSLPLPILDLFLPMWLGSAVGLGSILFVLLYKIRRALFGGDVIWISRERRLFMRASGSRSSSAIEDNVQMYVDNDALPLLRNLLFFAIVLCVFSVNALLTQILFYLWLVRSIIGMWHAILPVLSLGLLLLIYFYSIHTLTLWTCGVFTCVYVSSILFALKCRDQLGTYDSSWTFVCVPLFFAQASFASHLMFLMWRAWKGTLVFSSSFTQIACLVLYLIALVLTLHAELLTCFASPTIANRNYGITTWTLGLLCFAISALVVLNAESIRLARSKGFVAPLPLTKVEEGWVVLSNENEVTSTAIGAVSLRGGSQTLYLASLGAS